MLFIFFSPILLRFHVCFPSFFEPHYYFFFATWTWSHLNTQPTIRIKKKNTNNVSNVVHDYRGTLLVGWRLLYDAKFFLTSLNFCWKILETFFVNFFENLWKLFWKFFEFFWKCFFCFFCFLKYFWNFFLFFWIF